MSGNSSSGVLSEQNWGARINRFKNQWISPTGIPKTGTEQVECQQKQQQHGILEIEHHHQIDEHDLPLERYH